MKILHIPILLFLIAALLSPGNAQSKEVTIAFGQSVPPYIIQSNNTGIEIDIIREALKYRGHSLKIVYIPFIEILDVFTKNIADGAATVEEKIGIDGYFSDGTITYHNYAISLKKRNYDIKKIWDLRNYKVSAFQLARKYMGQEFARMAEANPLYRERQDQKAHVRLLYEGKIDVVVTDQNIFDYYQHQLSDIVDTSQELILHGIFPESNYKVVFRDKKIRDDFNDGLRHIKATGKDHEIYSSYIE